MKSCGSQTRRRAILAEEIAPVNALDFSPYVVSPRGSNPEPADEDDVRADLDGYGVTKLVGEDAFYSSVATVKAAFELRQEQPALDTAR